MRRPAFIFFLLAASVVPFIGCGFAVERAKIDDSAFVNHPQSTPTVVSMPDFGTCLIYLRKKKGTGTFIFKVGVNSLVKIVDLNTRKVHAYAWITANQPLVIKDVPESNYRFFFCENPYKLSDGSIKSDWFGKLDEIVSVGYGTRLVYELTSLSNSPRIVHSSATEFNKAMVPPDTSRGD